LSGDKNLPWVAYYVGGDEFLGPKVYAVEIYADWVNNRLRHPPPKLIYPEAVSTQKNTFTQWNSKDGGGIDQLLLMKDSPIQRKYLRLYNREVGAALYNESLAVDGTIKLARVMLGVEIDAHPESYSFPIKVCSSTPNQVPTCKTYEQKDGWP
jgi:hypothetical protein